MQTVVLNTRVLEAHRLIADHDGGRLDRAHPPEHIAGWRRTLLAALSPLGITATREPNSLTAEAVGLLLDVYQILVHAAPDVASLAGTTADLSVSSGGRRVLVLTDNGWSVVRVIDHDDGAPAAVALRNGTTFTVVRRTRRAAGGAEYDLVPVGLAGQIAAIGRIR